MPHHLSLSPQKGPTPPTLPKSAHPAEGAPTPQAWAGRLRKRTIEDLEASGSDVLDRATRRRLGTSRPTTKQFSHPPVLPKQQAPGAEEAQKIGRKTRRARDQGLRTSARSVITTRKTTRTSRQRPKKHSQSRNPRQEDLRRNAIEESLCASVEAPEDIPRPRTVKDCPRQVSEFIPQSAFEPEPLANKWTSTTRDPAAAGARKLTVDAVALLNGERDPREYIPGVYYTESELEYRQKHTQSEIDFGGGIMEGKSTPYDSDYPRKLTARRIYDEEVPPRKPDNFNEWDMAIRRSRLSASPPESEYYAFARNVRLYGNERTVQLDFPYFADLGRFPPDSIHGRTADLLWKDHVQINPIKSEPISKPQPDYVEGLTEDAVPFRVQNELQYNIQPTDKGPVLPNLTAELKATSGDMVKSRHQSRHAGAVCAQGFLEYDSKFRPNEKSFGKASVASIQYNAELVKGKLHWPVQGSDERGDPCSSTTEYHMTPLFAGMPIESYDDYKRAKRSVKNLMEQCQEVREQYHAHMHNLPPPGLPGGPQPLRGPETAAADYLPHTVVPSTALTPNTSNSSFTASNSSSGLHPSGQSATSPEQGPLADDLAAVHQAQSSVIQDGRVQEPEDTDSRNLAAGATSTKPRNREPVQKPRSRASRRKQNEIVQPSHIDHLAPSGPRRSSARLSSSRRGQR